MLRTLLPLLLAVSLLSGCGGMPSRDTPPPGLAEAERLFAEGEFAAAAQAFDAAAAESRGGRDFYRLRAAEAWREEGDLARAAGAVQAINPRKFDPESRLRLALLQAELALDRRDADAALAFLATPVGAVPPA